MRGFQFAATQLALLRDGMQRGLDRRPRDMARAADEERRLLEAIAGYRAVFVGRDPQMPQAFWDGASYRITFPDGVRREIAAPDEPVVPVPVPLNAAPAYVGGSPYGPPYGGHGAPPYGGYGAPPHGGYGAPPYGGYGGSPYGPPGGYGPPPYGGYGAPPHPGPPGGGYGPPPGGGYGPPSGGGYGPPSGGGYGSPPPS
jgi:hypothetical protein